MNWELSFTPFWKVSLWGFFRGALSIEKGCDEWHNKSHFIVIPLVGTFVWFPNVDRSGPEHDVYDINGDTFGLVNGCEICDEIKEELTMDDIDYLGHPISSNHWSVDLQTEDVMAWLQHHHKHTYDLLLIGFPEWKNRKGLRDSAHLDTEAMGVDPEWGSWLVDAIEATGLVQWVEGEPWAVENNK